MYADGYLPNIKTHLGDAGTQFSNAFVTEALCCPSRATFFTGQYAHNHGVVDNYKPYGGVTFFNASTALTVWLKNAGYATGMIGKYMNGYGIDPLQPLSNPENPRHIPVAWNFWRGLTSYQMYNYNVTQWDSTSGVTQLKTYSTYQTTKLKEFTVNFINALEAFDAMPFFIHVAPYAPHQEIEISGTGCSNPYWAKIIRPDASYLNSLPQYYTSLPQPPSYNEANVTDKPTFIRNAALLTAQEVGCARLQYQRRAEATRSIDDLVGGIIAALIAKNELANTVLIFTSDNGYFLGEHRLCCKIPGYEEGIRVPLVMRGPGVPVGSIAAPVLSNDLAPTLAAWAQASALVAMDGRSVVPLLANPSTPWRKRFLVEFQSDGQPPVSQFFGVRTASTDAVPSAYFAAWEDAESSIEFYDLATDPYQTTSNPASPHVATMQGYINALKDCGQPLKPTCQQAED